jgi:hypothetical protein
MHKKNYYKKNKKNKKDKKSLETNVSQGFFKLSFDFKCIFTMILVSFYALCAAPVFLRE